MECEARVIAINQKLPRLLSVGFENGSIHVWKFPPKMIQTNISIQRTLELMIKKASYEER